MVAVMGNRDALWTTFGDEWGWPPADMTREQDLADLERHADEMTRQESFNYAVLTDAEDRLLGCVYIDPLPTGPDGRPAAEVSWWMVARCVTRVARRARRVRPAVDSRRTGRSGTSRRRSST